MNGQATGITRSRERRPEWFKRDFILGYFGKKQVPAMKRYHDFVSALIDQEYKSPLLDITNPVILGSKEFITEIKDRFMGLKLYYRERESQKWIKLYTC